VNPLSVNRFGTKKPIAGYCGSVQIADRLLTSLVAALTWSVGRTGIQARCSASTILLATCYPSSEAPAIGRVVALTQLPVTVPHFRSYRRLRVRPARSSKRAACPTGTTTL